MEQIVKKSFKNTVKLRERRVNALKRLEKQLELGYKVHYEKKGIWLLPTNIELGGKDIERIQGEIKILKSRM